MPLYEYQCTQCNTRTEVLQRLDDAPLAACPACGGPVKKLISSPSFQFKGSGWYVTDYAKKGGASSPGKGDSSSSGGDGDKSSAGGDARSDAKSGGDAASSSDAKPAKTAAAAPAGKSGGD